MSRPARAGLNIRRRPRHNPLRSSRRPPRVTIGSGAQPCQPPSQNQTAKPPQKNKARARRKSSTITLAALAPTRLDELAASQRAMEASMREVLHNLQTAQFPSVPCDEFTQRLITEAGDDPSPSIPWEHLKSELGL